MFAFLSFFCAHEASKYCALNTISILISLLKFMMNNPKHSFLYRGRVLWSPIMEVNCATVEWGAEIISNLDGCEWEG